LYNQITNNSEEIKFSRLRHPKSFGVKPNYAELMTITDAQQPREILIWLPLLKHVACLTMGSNQDRIQVKDGDCLGEIHQ
jgi:hypothetical protein